MFIHAFENTICDLGFDLCPAFRLVSQLPTYSENVPKRLIKHLFKNHLYSCVSFVHLLNGPAICLNYTNLISRLPKSVRTMIKLQFLPFVKFGNFIR